MALLHADLQVRGNPERDALFVIESLEQANNLSRQPALKPRVLLEQRQRMAHPSLRLLTRGTARCALGVRQRERHDTRFKQRTVL